MKYHHHWAAAALLLVVTLGGSSVANAAAISGQGTWESTLQARDLDGNLSTAEAYYDTALNITWLADANYAGTEMNNANTYFWVTGLNPYSSGITGWRLPWASDTGTPGCNFGYYGTDCGYNVNTAGSEMAHMFYITLGNKAYYDTSGVGPQPGWGLTNIGPFSISNNTAYWTYMDDLSNPSNAFYFIFADGSQNTTSKSMSLYAWAVHSGDVGTPTVPVPAAVWLFGSGLLGLLGVARRRKTT